MLKFFSGLSLEGWLIGFALLGALGFLGKYQYDEWQLSKAKLVVHDQKATIVAQQDFIDTTKKADQLKEVVQVETQQAVKVVVTKHETIQQKAENTSHAIELQYQQLPVTVENLQQEQQQLSEVRINAMWEAYCTASPQATDCQSTTPAGETHA